ncbi:MAG: hypothetical protein O2875_01045 [Planctomycetota bacterium]|nr:hypothetical protein [Planctomycetota bacterium]
MFFHRFIYIIVAGLFLIHGWPALAVPQQAVPAERQAGNIAIIPIRGPIDDLTVISVMRRTELAVANGAQAIVLEFDTPGGDMLATLQLCNYIKTQMPVNTIAWIHPHAFSAGAILALATREILVGPASAFGDAAPIQVIPGVGLIPMPQTERAKMEAPLVAEVVDSARMRGYDEHLVQSFVRLGSELWLIRNPTNGKRAIVDAEEYRTVFGSEPPRQAATVPPSIESSGEGEDESEGLIPYFSRYQSKPMLEGPPIVPQISRPRLTESDRGQWELIEQIAKSDQLLVVYPDEAIALGLAKGRAANEQEIGGWFGATTVTRYEESWSELLVRFLTTWPVRIALIVVLLVAFVLEALTPGFGVFGTLAIIALLLLIGAPALVGLAEWWELIAGLNPFSSIALDIVILPLGGWVAVIGGALVLTGLVSSFVTRDISSAIGQQQLFMGIGSTLVGIFGSTAILWFFWKFLPQSQFLRRATLQSAASSQSSDAISIPSNWPEIGTEAIAITTLRPTGRVQVGSQPFDAQTNGEFVEIGTRVRIVRRRGTTLEVEVIYSESPIQDSQDQGQSTT